MFAVIRRQSSMLAPSVLIKIAFSLRGRGEGSWFSFLARTRDSNAEARMHDSTIR